jgi:hypothetical protein
MSVKKPILVVTTPFVKPVETRIDNEFEVRRKADGTPFQHGELLAAADGADALFIPHANPWQNRPHGNAVTTEWSFIPSLDLQAKCSIQLVPVLNVIHSAEDR